MTGARSRSRRVGVLVVGRPCSGGRVATLIYDRTPYGQVRLAEFDGHLDPVYFEKFVHLGNVTEVRLNGTKGLWVTGRRRSCTSAATARSCRLQPG